MTYNPKLQITPRWLNLVRMRNSFFPYFYMHSLANEPKPSRPVYILLRMMHLCPGLHSAAKIYQQIWVAILAKKRLKETAYRNVEFLHSFLRRDFTGKPVVES